MFVIVGIVILIVSFVIALITLVLEQRKMLKVERDSGIIARKVDEPSGEPLPNFQKSDLNDKKEAILNKENTKGEAKTAPPVGQLSQERTIGETTNRFDGTIDLGDARKDRSE